MAVFGKGGEGSEASEKAGGYKGEDPGRGGFMGEVSEEKADEEAAEEVTAKDPNRETVERSLCGETLDGRGEGVASERAETTA